MKCQHDHFAKQKCLKLKTDYFGRFKLGKNIVLIATLLLTSMSIARADSWWGESDAGFQITAAPQAGFQYNEGETAKIKGSVKKVKFNDHNDFDDDDDFDFGGGNFGKDSEVKFFFPDLLTEVTSQVTLDKKRRNFSFTTPALSKNNVNQFIAIVQKKNGASSNTNLLRHKAKMERHLQLLLARPRHPKTDHLIDLFRQLIARIDLRLSGDLSVLAELDLPLRVGESTVAASYRSMSLANGFQFDLKMSPGVIIEGSKSTANVMLTNYRHLTHGENPNEKPLWSADIKFENVLQKNFSPQIIPLGSSISTSFVTAKQLSGEKFLDAILYKKKNQSASSQFQAKFSSRLEVVEDNVAPTIAVLEPTTSGFYTNISPNLSFKITDSFGEIDSDTVKVLLSGNLFSGQVITNQNVKDSLQVTIANAGSEQQITGAIPNLLEGSFQIVVQAKDIAGNSAVNQSVSFVYDKTAPALALTLSSTSILTSNPNLILPIQVTDYSPTTTKVLVNGAEVQSSDLVAFDAHVVLREGTNAIEIDSVDAAGNAAIPIKLFDVVLDSTAPQLTLFAPQDGASLNTLSFTVSGAVNEKITSAKVNGQPLTIDPGAQSFQGTYVAVTEGQQTLNLEFIDLVGNVGTKTITVGISLRALNAALVSITPDSVTNHLWVRGAPGATRPFSQVTASAGFFNNGAIQSATDGSFQIKLSPFTNVTVTATDTASNRTDSANFSYGTNTMLSGTVRDDEKNPLPGVVVRIDGTGQQTITDASGVFTFQEPVTGDQKLVFDGSQVNLPNSPQKKFSKTSIAISVGLLQSNVIPRPIYLLPLLTDGTESHIENGSSVVVSSPHAPGVEVDIPSNVATFPNGSKTGDISIATVSAEVSTIAPLDFASPENVVALEPSGLHFSEPVQLTLPNTSELPAGTDVVIMSMNSTKGIWEIGGAGRVTSDGSSIVTKDGMGLLHFSVVYATPIMGKVAQVGAADKPGTDTFNGSLSTSITAPSYKSMGNSIAPTLLYKSAWARPTALLTNTFDVPRNDIHLDIQNDLGGQRDVYNITVFETAHGWIEPDFVKAQFTSGGFTGEELTFTGIPNQSVISYALELKDPTTQVFLPSGMNEYLSHWEMHLKQLIARTRKIRLWQASTGAADIIRQDSWMETRQIEKAFPSDLQSQIYIQNESKSAAGSGWKIAGIQRIANPESSRIMLEEADGSIATYSINNTINTDFNASSTSVDLNQGSDFSTYPKMYFSGGSAKVFEFQSGLDTSPRLKFSIPPLTGSYVAWDSPVGLEKPNLITTVNYQIFLRTSNLSQAGSKIYLADNFFNSIYESDFTNAQKVAGRYESSYPFCSGRECNGPDVGNAISARCGSLSRVYDPQVPDWQTRATPAADYMKSVTQSMTGSYSVSTSVPAFPATGNGCFGLSSPSCNYNYLDYLPCGNGGNFPAGSYVGGGAGVSKFNGLMDIKPGPRANSVIVADTGNNRVRLLDLNTQSVVDIVGNGNNTDHGDGGLATQAGIFHPRGLAYDSIGNLYISTENGFIRKVDVNGVITTFAGGRLENGGTVGDSVPAERIILNRPTGLVVDNDHGYLYVADTGAHVIRRIDFLTKTAVTVAGNNSSGFNGDGIAALNASLSNPSWIGLDDDNNLVINDVGNSRIRKVVFASSQNSALSYVPSNKDLSKLSKLADGTWIREYRNGVKTYFDAAGRQVATVDRVGRQTTWSYDADGNLISMTDPVGRVLQYQYSGGKLSSIVDPAGRRTNFFYSGDYLTQVTMPDGATTQYGYNAQGLLSSERNARGFETQYEYNQWNRLSKVVRPDATEISVNDSGSLTAANNFTGGSVGQLKKFGENEVYDGIKDAKSVETKFIKDTTGYVTTIIDGAGQTTTVERNLDGKPTKITRPDGSTVLFNYNAATQDLLSQTDSALGITTSQVFDSFGNMTSSTNGRGFTSQASYHPVTGLLLAKSDPLGHGVSYAYNALGLPIALTNAIGKTSSTTYDASGNVATSVDPLSKTSTYVRDLAGNVVSMTNANNQVTVYEYDAMNRLTSVITPKGEKTEYSYLATGQLSQIKDPLGNIVSFEYNALGQLTKKIDQLGFAVTRTYDESGNVATEADANGNVKTFTYNTLNQLVQKTLPDNVVQLQYDIRGNVILAKDSDSEIALGYDDGGRLVSTNSHGIAAEASLPNVTLQYNYDANGNRRALVDPTGTTQYFYDNADRLTSLQNSKGEVFGFSFDAANRITAMSRPGSSTALAFDDRNFVTSIVHSRVGATLASFNYVMDNIGNRTQVATLAGNFDYGYDNNNQVVSATNPESAAGNNPSRSPSSFAAETFNYDQIYNRTGDQGGNYSYDNKSQRLVEDYRNFYFYDNNGNLISKQQKGLNGPTTNFEYSSENQLRAFKVFDPAYSNTNPAKEVLYLYDATGKRIAKRVVDHQDSAKSFERRYVYDGQEILLEYDESNALLARYTHSGLRTDDVLAVDARSSKVAQSTGSYFYHKDALGTVTDVTDSSGIKIQHYMYSVFGVLLGIQDAQASDVTANAPLKTSYTFTGREFDAESGYYYYRARFYDSDTGRFLQKDSEPGRVVISGSIINSYSYVLNDCTSFSDPFGRSLFNPVFTAFISIVGGIPTASLISGILGTISNVSSAMEIGASTEQQSLSGFIGFVTGAVSSASWAAGPEAGIPISFAAGFINVTLNQWMFYGWDNINWKRAVIGGATNVGVSAIGYGVSQWLGGVLNPTPANAGGNAVSTGVSFYLDNGISPKSPYPESWGVDRDFGGKYKGSLTPLTE